MSYASSIIERLGGVRPAANLLGFPPTTVQEWKSAGVIPARRQQHVLNMARANGIDLRPADFFDEPAPDLASPSEAA